MNMLIYSNEEIIKFLKHNFLRNYVKYLAGKNISCKIFYYPLAFFYVQIP